MASKRRRKLWSRLFERFQVRCTHQPQWVNTDLLEGEFPGQVVEWCLRCGAFRRGWAAEGGVSSTRLRDWTVPRATWAERWPR